MTKPFMKPMTLGQQELFTGFIGVALQTAYITFFNHQAAKKNFNAQKTNPNNKPPTLFSKTEEVINRTRKTPPPLRMNV